MYIKKKIKKKDLAGLHYKPTIYVYKMYARVVLVLQATPYRQLLVKKLFITTKQGVTLQCNKL